MAGVQCRHAVCEIIMKLSLRCTDRPCQLTCPESQATALNQVLPNHLGQTYSEGCSSLQVPPLYHPPGNGVGPALKMGIKALQAHQRSPASPALALLSVYIRNSPQGLQHYICHALQGLLGSSMLFGLHTSP